MNCPLCNNRSELFSRDKKREYFRCTSCDFIFVPPKFHLSNEKEIERYKLHTNSGDDPRYRAFLNRIVPVITSKVEKDANGVDFGCGPSPILPNSLLKEGIIVKPYDPLFHNNINILKKRWDFIVSTEVFEHFNTPSKSIESIWELIKENGYLFIMTQLYSDDMEFKSWYYKGDQTHIGFFTRKTFNILAVQLKAEVEFHNKDIIVLRKV